MATITDPTASGVRAGEIPAICDLKFLRDFTGRSSRFFDAGLAAGTFPRPDLMLGNRRAWYRATVRKWLQQQETKR